MITQQIDQKAWTTLTARAAKAGYALLRTDPQDGPVRLLVERFNLIRQMNGTAAFEDLRATAEGSV